jgi:RNA polymerase sigma-70 factor (ECF subfamily)
VVSDWLGPFYEKYGGLVFRRARAILREEQPAKDVTQEVFVRALGSKNDLSNQPSPVAWLYRVTTNCCLNLLRDRKRRGELEAENLSADDANVPQPEVRLTLARLLDRLPEDLREIAVYYYLDDMKQHEIAEILGVSQRTISTRLDQFRAAVQDAWAVPRREVQ